MMMKIKVNVENYCTVSLTDDYFGCIHVSTADGTPLGCFDPYECEDWNASDEHIISAILEELFDEGELITPISEWDYRLAA